MGKNLKLLPSYLYSDDSFLESKPILMIVIEGAYHKNKKLQKGSES
jgi:hypothetical protein